MHAAIDSPLVIEPLEIVLIPTGVGFQIPKNYEIQVRARSGLALKNGLSLVNGIGTIDADYRGEVSVIAINLGQKAINVNPGDRIAQAVMIKTEKIEFEEVTELEESGRGLKGFGSTGTSA